MFSYETKYIIINSNSEINYIYKIIEHINKSIDKVLDFFEIDYNIPKIKLYIVNNSDVRREYINNYNKEPYIFMCDCVCTKNNIDYIMMSNLESRKMIKRHENDTLEDLKMSIIHEFTHVCYHLINRKSYGFLSEGIAIYLSEQKFNNSSFDATLDEMKYGCKRYSNYYLMFKYVIDKYGKDYILKLIKDDNLRISETSRLFEEAVNYYK